MAKKSSSKGIGLANSTCAPSYRPTKEQAEQERRWRAESDLRTLREAEQISADRGRLNYAKKVATEEMRALERVSGKKR